MPIIGPDGATLPSDPTENRVIQALYDDRYDFRTVGGISRELDLPDHVVEAALDRWGNLVRLSGVPGPNGERLYTLRTRPETVREKLAIARAALEKSVT